MRISTSVLAASVASAACALAAAQEFPQPRVASGARSPSAALAPLNGDAALDLLVADAQSGALYVWLGDGAGSFAAGNGTGVGVDPRAVRAADLDLDGAFDAVTVNAGSADVSVALGDGNGGLGPVAAFGAGLVPVALVAADLDGDGSPDLAVANDGPGTAGVLIGDGHGSFASPQFHGSGGHAPRAIAAGDFDLDGALDLALGDALIDAIGLLRGTGTGAFLPVDLFSAPADPVLLEAADFDGDGLPDLVVAGGASASPHEVAYLPSLAGGGFGAPVVLATGSLHTALAVGEFDGSAGLDVAVAESAGSTVKVISGDGQGGVAGAVVASVPFDPKALAAGDLDGDGRADLTIASGGQTSNYDHPAISTLLSAPGGGLAAAAHHAFGADVRSFALGDLDGDGHADAVAARYSAFQLVRRLGDGAGGFGPPASAPTDAFPNSVALGDLDGDGDLDAVTANNGVAANDVTALRNDGAGTLAPIGNFPAGAFAADAALADVDSDGRLDAVVATNLAGFAPPGHVTVLRGTAAGFAPPLHSAVQGFAHSLALADVDGDGRVDVVTGDASSNKLQTLLGDGLGTFALSGSVVAADDPLDLQLGDLDADGRPDLVAAISGSLTFAQHLVAVYRGTGSGAFLLAQSLSAEPTVSSLALADLDQDGRLDVVAGNSAPGSFSVLHNGPGGVLAAPAGHHAQRFVRAVGAADFDGDGRLDVAALAAEGALGELIVARNLGACGTFLPYGSGCPGAGGFAPQLSGSGCAAAGEVVALAVANGTGGAPGVLFFGLAPGHAAVTPLCPLLVAPLLPFSIPFALAGSGPGAGTFGLAAPIPASLSGPFDFTVQALIGDPMTGIAATNGLAVHVE